MKNLTKLWMFLTNKYNNMKHVDRVNKVVMKFDENWFNCKKEWYEREVFYDKKLQKIHDTIPDVVEYDEEGNEIARPDIIIDYTLEEYCWDGDYGHGPYHFEDVALQLPVDGYTIADKIISEIELMVKHISEVTVKYNIVKRVVKAVEDAVEELLDNDVSESYVKVMAHVLYEIKCAISEKYGIYKQALDIAGSHKEILAFNLNQEELAALIYIVYKADIFHVPVPGDTSFLNFCGSHFHFYNQKAKGHTPATRIRDKFNDVKNIKATKAFEKVIKKLKDAFKE
jgi:hypothetical protein